MDDKRTKANVSPEDLPLDIKLDGVSEKLDSLGNRGMKFGTDRTRALLDELGSPDKKLKIIHVAGTNGKGSVCEYISRILTASGKKVATYVSPFVYDCSEQYRVNCVPVESKKIVKCFEAVFATETSKIATRFEIETAAAIYAFANEGCEYAVIECGMGGLNDATNAVYKKELAVITSISLEHTAFLGDTLEKICEQKAGIIKDCPVVVSSLQPPEVRKYFEKLGAIFPEEPQILHGLGMKFAYKGDEYSTAMSGPAQPYNAALAIEAVKLLGFEIDERIKSGIAKAYLCGRIEYITTPERIYILDGAHNPASFEPLVSFAKTCKKMCDGKLDIVYGCLSDKDIDGCLKRLKDLSDVVYAVGCESPRAMDYEKMCAACERYFPTTVRAGGVENALENCRAKLVVVCGSFTLLKEAKKWIEKRS